LATLAIAVFRMAVARILQLLAPVPNALPLQARYAAPNPLFPRRERQRGRSRDPPL
jgi:hypothetical protein